MEKVEETMKPRQKANIILLSVVVLLHFLFIFLISPLIFGSINSRWHGYEYKISTGVILSILSFIFLMIKIKSEKKSTKVIFTTLYYLTLLLLIISIGIWWFADSFYGRGV
ncbi:MAG: hypothetical protein LBM99_01695 [Bacillales bacterium]|jgi:hypothetical protein|nr:hypothetical protein [Bacillales bacterium]